MRLGTPQGNSRFASYVFCRKAVLCLLVGGKNEPLTYAWSRQPIAPWKTWFGRALSEKISFIVSILFGSIFLL
jgi:hypothetical protein